MKRKTLFIILATLVLSLTSCAMSTDEIATALSNINNEYQSGTYEQAQTEIVKLEKVTKKMTDEQKSKYDELKPLIEYATQKSGEINNALNDAQSLCDQKMYYEASQSLDKIATDYKLPPTEQKKFDEEKTTAENGIKSVKITDALKNVETIYNGGDYDKATEELSKIDTSNLTDAQSQKYQSLQTNITNAKAAAEKAAAEKAAAEKEPSFLKKLFSGKKARKSADMQRRLRHGRTARVLTVEHEILPESVRLFCAEKLGVDGRQVHVL